MKFIIMVMCMAALALAEEKYDSSTDDIDLDLEIFGNDRLIVSYSKCLLNKGPCTPEVKKLKEKLPEVLQTRCAKCSDKQKQMGKQLIQEIKSKHPQIWSELSSFYDPQGKYKKALEEFLKP